MLAELRRRANVCPTVIRNALFLRDHQQIDALAGGRRARLGSRRTGKRSWRRRIGPCAPVRTASRPRNGVDSLRIVMSPDRSVTTRSTYPRSPQRWTPLRIEMQLAPGTSRTPGSVVRWHFCQTQGPSGRRQRFNTWTTIAPPSRTAASICRIARSTVASVRGQRQRVADANGGVERLGRGDRLVEPPHRPVQALGLAEAWPGPVDHGRAEVGPLDPQPPGVEHRRVMARAAGHVDHAPHAAALEQPAIERLLMGKPLRPVDHRLVNVGKVVEHACTGYTPQGRQCNCYATGCRSGSAGSLALTSVGMPLPSVRCNLVGGMISQLAAEIGPRLGVSAVAIGMK